MPWEPFRPSLIQCRPSQEGKHEHQPARVLGHESGRELVDDGGDHGIEVGNLVAVDTFDVDRRVLAPLAAAGKTAVIPPKMYRRLPRDFDHHLYKARHLIENFFAKLKQYRAIATRYDKTARNFLAGIQLLVSAIWLN